MNIYNKFYTEAGIYSLIRDYEQRLAYKQNEYKEAETKCNPYCTILYKDEIKKEISEIRATIRQLKQALACKNNKNYEDTL